LKLRPVLLTVRPDGRSENCWNEQRPALLRQWDREPIATLTFTFLALERHNRRRVIIFRCRKGAGYNCCKSCVSSFELRTRVPHFYENRIKKIGKIWNDAW